MFSLINKLLYYIILYYIILGYCIVFVEHLSHLNKNIYKVKTNVIFIVRIKHVQYAKLATKYNYLFRGYLFVNKKSFFYCCFFFTKSIPPMWGD